MTFGPRPRPRSRLRCWKRLPQHAICSRLTTEKTSAEREGTPLATGRGEWERVQHKAAAARVPIRRKPPGLPAQRLVPNRQFGPGVASGPIPGIGDGAWAAPRCSRAIGRLDLRIDGRPVEPAEWTCVCWHSDDDGDYLELQTRPVGCARRATSCSCREPTISPSWPTRSWPDGHAKIESRLAADPRGGLRGLRPITQSRVPFVVRRRSGAGLSPGPQLSARRGSRRPIGCVGRPLGAESESGLGGLYAPLVLDWNPRRAPQSGLLAAIDGRSRRCGRPSQRGRRLTCSKSALRNG